MRPQIRTVLIALAAMAAGALASTVMLSLPPTRSEAQPVVAGPVHPIGPKHHGMVIHVDQNDPAVMKMALANAENLIAYYEDKGEEVDVEFVANGPGLHMLRSDTSPVKDRIAALSRKRGTVSFKGCGNTIRGQSRDEEKAVTLIPEASIVPAGIGRILERQEQGWAYFRP